MPPQPLQEPGNGDSLTRFIGLVDYSSNLIEPAEDRLAPLLDVLKGSNWNAKKPKPAPEVVYGWADR